MLVLGGPTAKAISAMLMSCHVMFTIVALQEAGFGMTCWRFCYDMDSVIMDDNDSDKGAKHRC